MTLVGINVQRDAIDKRAEELFRLCGGLPIEWGVVDECVRLHYRRMAAREIKPAKS